MNTLGIIACWSLSGMLRGGFGSWTGGLIVGFLGGLSLGLDIFRLTLFTFANALVFSQGWGKFIEAIQTGKNSFYGYMGLTWLGITYCLCGLILPDFPTSIVMGNSTQIYKLGFGMLAFPLALLVESIAEVHLKNWDSWKFGEFAMTGWLGFIFSQVSYIRPPLPYFGLIVFLFTIMGVYKYVTTETGDYKVPMLMILLCFFINLLLYV